MPKKNRSYKRGEPFRDATFLVIACEGAKREKEYFETLAKKNQRIKVRVLSPSEDVTGRSAPHWLLERAITFTQEIGGNEYDKLWFVLDIDRWSRANLEAIKAECQVNWDIALSNPCFEVWLIMHYLDPSGIESTSCKKLKTELNSKVIGGYKIETALSHIQTAIQRAKNADQSVHFIPRGKTTKVYKLVEEIIKK